MRFLILSMLLSTLVLANDNDTGSKYTPMCFETHHKCDDSRNSVLLFVGASQLTRVNQPNESLFTVGYTRRILPDLSIGGLLNWTDSRFLGYQIGLQYHF